MPRLALQLLHLARVHRLLAALGLRRALHAAGLLHARVVRLVPHARALGLGAALVPAEHLLQERGLALLALELTRAEVPLDESGTELQAARQEVLVQLALEPTGLRNHGVLGNDALRHALQRLALRLLDHRHTVLVRHDLASRIEGLRYFRSIQGLKELVVVGVAFGRRAQLLVVDAVVVVVVGVAFGRRAQLLVLV